MKYMELTQTMTKPFFAAMTAVALIGTSHAALVAYESFETTSADGQNLPSMDRTGSSDFGWGDQWRWNDNTDLGITVDSPGLGFGDLDTAGKLASSNFNGSSAGQYRRELSASYTISSGPGGREEMWASWLSTWSGNGDGTGGNAFQWFKLHNGNTEVIAAGINNWGGVRGTALEDQWRLAPGDAANQLDSFTGVVASPGETYMLSMRLSATEGNTLVELFVNSNGNREIGSPLATHTLSGAATFNQIRLQTQQTNITAEWDEIRIGESFSSVGLIPEPTVALLGSLGLLTLLRRRRTT